MKEDVREYLKDKMDAVDLITINDALGYNTAEELSALGEVLDQMEKDLEVFMTKKHKYILYDNCKNFRKGIIDVNKHGDGYLKVTEPGETDIFVPKTELRYALDGDTVLVEVVELTSKDDKRERTRGANDKRTGRVIKILKRDISNIVGEIKKDKEGLYFESYDKRDVEFILPGPDLLDTVEGEIVVLEPVENIGKNKYTARIKSRLGHKDDAGMDIKVICAKHDVYDVFPDDVVEQLDLVPNEISDKDKVGRVDLTDKVIFTIDGKDTKDIDDAISLDMDNEGNYILGVHIADVSYYVQEGTPLDTEALKRGTSCYPPGSVIPMLPHKLSNGICSLNEGVERCAMTCEMTINGQGRVIDSEVYPSIIRSRKKMNYDDVNSVIERDEVPEGYEPFADTLKEMLELAHIIRKERENRGASDFDIQEAKVVCDMYGKPIEIVCRERGEGERLIEDFMIAANETVARTIYYNKQYGVQLPGVYRVHETPLVDKVQSFISFCSSMGYVIKGNYKSINFKTLKSILEQINFKNDTEERIIKSMAVRSMPKAFYSPENLGHYGLASKCYTHFTSPIRRYPDLQTHRLLRTFIYEKRTDAKTVGYYTSLLPEVCKQTSDREVKAAEAERECVKMKMAEYMMDHIGEEFTAVVTGITSFGMFVQLPNLVEGLVPISGLDGYYVFDEASQTLTNKESKQKYTMGTELKVKCVNASKEAMTIDFDIIKESDKIGNKKSMPSESHNEVEEQA